MGNARNRANNYRASKSERHGRRTSLGAYGVLGGREIGPDGVARAKRAEDSKVTAVRPRLVLVLYNGYGGVSIAAKHIGARVVGVVDYAADCIAAAELNNNDDNSDEAPSRSSLGRQTGPHGWQTDASSCVESSRRTCRQSRRTSRA